MPLDLSVSINIYLKKFRGAKVIRKYLFMIIYFFGFAADQSEKGYVTFMVDRHTNTIFTRKSEINHLLTIKQKGYSTNIREDRFSFILKTVLWITAFIHSTSWDHRMREKAFFKTEKMKGWVKLLSVKNWNKELFCACVWLILFFLFDVITGNNKC